MILRTATHPLTRMVLTRRLTGSMTGAREIAALSIQTNGGLIELLTNEDKERIYQEEAYRGEVRQQLDKASSPKTKAGQIWAVLNSKFVLWFLGSVVLGIITFVYARWDKQRALDKEQREKAAHVARDNIRTGRKLDAEISDRLLYFFHTQEITLDPAAPHGISALLSEEGIKSLDDPNAFGNNTSDFEYATRNLRSLLLELKEVVPDEEKREIDLAFDEFVIAQALFIDFQEAIRKAKKDPALKDKSEFRLRKFSEASKDAPGRLTRFCEAFNLERWGEPVPKEEEIHIEN